MIIGFDGDVLFWTAATARKGISLPEACGACKSLIRKALDLHETDEFKIVVTSTDKSNFRYKIKVSTKEYKANRKEKQKPEHLMAVRQYLLDNWKAIEVFGMEADDWLGIWQTSNINNNISSVIHGKDKDLKQIPGRHSNFDGEITEVTELGHLKLYKETKWKIPKWVLQGSGLKWLYAQMIMGDTCDNVTGLVKKGPVFAYDTLNHCKNELSLYKATLRAYNNKQHLMDEQAQLVYILRKEGEYWLDRKQKLLSGDLK